MFQGSLVKVGAVVAEAKRSCSSVLRVIPDRNVALSTVKAASAPAAQQARSGAGNGWALKGSLKQMQGFSPKLSILSNGRVK